MNTKASKAKQTAIKQRGNTKVEKVQKVIGMGSLSLSVCKSNFERPYLPIYLPKMAPTRLIGKLRKCSFL